METKNINLLNDSSNEESKFSTKKWYVIDTETGKDKYNQNNCIEFETEGIKPSLCDYSDAFILVTGDITNNDTHITFENCAPFSTCKTEINDMFIDEANYIYIVMPMYNLIECFDNSDISGSLWQFKRDEPPANNVDLNINNGVFHSQSFRYKAALVGKMTNPVNNTDSSVKNTKIVLPRKYLSRFWRSLEMPLIDCKVHLELNWIEDCILSNDGDSAKFKITDAKLHVQIVILSAKDNANLTKQLSDGFKRSVYWNSYQTIPAKVIKKGINIYELISVSVQDVKRLFALAYFIAAGANADEETDIKDNKIFSSKRRD